MTTSDNYRTVYTLADSIEAMRAETAEGIERGYFDACRAWDNFRSHSESMKRTTYHADGDRTKWCEGCGCGTRQERQWLYTCEDGSTVTKIWGPDEDETASPVWTCSNCDHSTKRLVQSDETRQRRSDKKLAESLAKIERETAEQLYRFNMKSFPKPFHMIEEDGITARQMLRSDFLAADDPSRPLFEKDLAEWEAAKAEQA